MVAIRIVEITDTYLDYDKGDGVQRLLYADIPGNGWPQQRLNRARDRLQDLLDFRQPLADLPVDDPDKTTDPALPDLFWDGNDLVGRNTVVDWFRWDGVRLSVRVSNP